MAKKVIQVTERSNEVMEDTVRRVRSIKGGPGIRVSNTSAGITISLAAKKPYNPAPPVRGGETFDAKITAVTAINGLIRWRYTIEIGYWDMTNSPETGGVWTALDGMAGLDAFNSAEDKNTFTGDGVIGTGNHCNSTTGIIQDAGGTPGSCKLLPLPVGGYVTVKRRGPGDEDAENAYTIINAMNSAEVP